ncbi:MAG: tyrosine--tRNA ligase [Eggerthellaceae bacterium]|nr:tyrosine--tRNA ligase [Eggerthellaceae bacterium]
MTFLSPEDQLHIIKSGTTQIVPEAALLEKLKRGKPLNVKLGVDPTAPDIHLGHAVPLRKLRTFQDLGHQVTLIIGDGTALVGDPSGRSSTRPQLSSAEIKANAQTYVDQAFKILDPQKTILKYNSEWLLALTLEELLKITANFTVARILERDDFHKRYTSNQSISLHEFFYPVMQAYDSVVIEADVEIGGTDQLFNLLAGRELMEKVGIQPQVCLTLPLLEGTDGVQKMSKSYGNYIGLTDDAADMFGKVMSIPDEMMVKYYRLASTVAVDEIDQIESGLAQGTLHPNQVKRSLAKNIVETYYNKDVAIKAEEQFDLVFKQHAIPDEVDEFKADLSVNDEGKVYLAKLIADAGLTSSVGEARRMIDGGAVKINGEAVGAQVYNVDPALLDNAVVQVGKRKFIRFI